MNDDGAMIRVAARLAICSALARAQRLNPLVERSISVDSAAHDELGPAV